MIKIYLKTSEMDKQEIPLKLGKFPVGEISVMLGDIGSKLKRTNTENTQSFEIVWKFEDTSEVLALWSIRRALKRFGSKDVHLVSYYLPYSRMDREIPVNPTRFVEGEIGVELGVLHALLDMLECMQFTTITVLDPHSTVIERVPNLVVKSFVVPTVVATLRAALLDQDVLILFPDITAEKRYKSAIKEELKTDKYKHTVHFMTCHKTRGEQGLNSTVVGGLSDVEELKGVKLIICVDDMCSRGGTFLEAFTQLEGELEKRGVFIQAKRLLVVAHTEENIYSGELWKSIEHGEVSLSTTDSVWTRDARNIQNGVGVLSIFSGVGGYFLS